MTAACLSVFTYRNSPWRLPFNHDCKNKHCAGKARAGPAHGRDGAHREQAPRFGRRVLPHCGCETRFQQRAQVRQQKKGLEREALNPLKGGCACISISAR